MKNITALAAALLLAACGSNQFVVTSEVGEKMIVKKNTIVLTEQSSDLDNKQWLGEYASELDQEVDCLGSIVRCADHTAAWKHREKLAYRPVWRKAFRYVPIFVDLNGQQRVGKEKQITCTDRKIVEAAPTSFTNTFKWALDPNAGRTLEDKLGRRLCKQYAGF